MQDCSFKFCNNSFFHTKIHGGGYGLRENPKKSWKFSSLGSDHQSRSRHDCIDQVQETVKCLVCGKEFESSRSLNGHMRHHSKQERKKVMCRECGKVFKSLRCLSGHMRLHTGPNLVAAMEDNEAVNVVRRKRSKRVRHELSDCSSLASFSASGSEFESLEFEVADCLIMLSRGGFDNVEWVKLEEADSFGFASNSQNLIECKTSCDRDMKFVESGVQNEDFDNAIKELDEDMLEDGGDDSSGFEFTNSSTSEKSEFDASAAELGINPSMETECSAKGPNFSGDSSKKSEFKCKICDKIFTNYQSLGGHQTFHRTRRGPALKAQKFRANNRTTFCNFSGKDSAQQQRQIGESKKRKEYKCQICTKTFLSVQGLGAHTRAHLARVKEEQIAED